MGPSLTAVTAASGTKPDGAPAWPSWRPALIRLRPETLPAPQHARAQVSMRTCSQLRRSTRMSTTLSGTSTVA